MVDKAGPGELMDKDVEAGAVQHQPRQQVRQFLGGEGDLIHRPRMRADRLVVPSADPGLEALADRGAQPRRKRAGVGVIIDMRVIAGDAGGIDERGHYAFSSAPFAQPGGVAAPGPSARCISTTSTQSPNLKPTAGNRPTRTKPSASCSRIDGHCSRPPITATICR